MGCIIYEIIQITKTLESTILESDIKAKWICNCLRSVVRVIDSHAVVIAFCWHKPC